MIEFRPPAFMSGNVQQHAHVAFDVYVDGVFKGVVRSVGQLPPPDPDFVPEAPGDAYAPPAAEVEKLIETGAWLAFDGPRGHLEGRYPDRQAAGTALAGVSTT